MEISDARGQTASDTARAGPSRMVRLLGLLGALGLASLDGTIVATALPVIASDLGGLDHLAWVVTSFLLAQSASLPLYGKLSDLYGRRPVFFFAVGIFLMGSVGCGLAGSMGQLIVMRAFQGAGAGGLMTLSQIVLGDIFSPRERGRYQGLFTATFAACNIAGPLLGGAITAYVGWRWIFLINIPLGLAVLAILAVTLPQRAPGKIVRVDVAGALLIIITTLASLATLSLGGAFLPWTSPAIAGLVALAIVAGAALLWHERRTPEPMLDLTLFADPLFRRCGLAAALIGFPFFGAIIFLPLYLQLVRGIDAATAGMITLPQIGGLLIASAGGGFLVSYYGRYKPFMVGGVATMAVSLAFVGHAMMTDSPIAVIMVGLFFVGGGSGCTMANLTLAAQNAAGDGRMGAATSLINFANSVAAAAGVALSGALIVQRVHGSLRGHVPDAALARLASAGVHDVPHLAGPMRDLLRSAYAHAIAQQFLIGGAILLLALLATIAVPGRELRTNSAA